MTKKFTINCDFGGQLAPFSVYIGTPQKGHHPLHFQADWLSKVRGGTVPSEIMDAVTQLQELAEKNGVALEDLCVYALGTEKQQAELEGLEGDVPQDLENDVAQDNEYSESEVDLEIDEDNEEQEASETLLNEDHPQEEDASNDEEEADIEDDDDVDEDEEDDIEDDDIEDENGAKLDLDNKTPSDKK